MSSRSIHAMAGVRIFILVQVEPCSIVWMDRIVFIHHVQPSTDTWVVSTLWGLCKASVNMDVQLSPWDSAFNNCGWIPRHGIPRSHGRTTFIFFEELANCFPQQLLHFTFLQPCLWAPFLRSLASTCFLYFRPGHPNGYEVSHCRFDLHFPADRWCWASFHVLLAVCLLWINDYSSPLPFKPDYFVVAALLGFFVYS